jgi:hypothetical protein
LCSKLGNRISNSYYEYRLPPNFPRPGEPGGATEGIEDWIRCKYERKDYAPSKRGEKSPTPAELIQQGRDPDIYARDDENGRDSREGDKASGSTESSKEASAANATCKASQETRTLLDQLKEYYARVGQSKSQEQLEQIVDKYTGKETTLWAMLDKKYGTLIDGPATNWANFSDVSSNVPPTDSWSIPAVDQQQTQQQPASDAYGLMLAAQQQETQKDQQIDMLKHNLSALYQMPSGSVTATNGSNYTALAQMGLPNAMPLQHPAQQIHMSQMRQMMAMQQQGYVLS